MDGLAGDIMRIAALSGIATTLTMLGIPSALRLCVSLICSSGCSRFSASLPWDIDYPSADRSVETAPREVTTTTDYDEIGRPLRVRSSGKDGPAPEEWFAYDRNGRLVRHRHQLTSASGTKLVEEMGQYG